MSYINAPLRHLFDAILSPFVHMSPWVTLAPLALILAVIMLLIFKKVSNQEGIEAVKRKIHAGFFEIRLFNDDLGAIMRAQWDILRYNLRYLLLSLKPMLFMFIPILLLVAQLQFHYGYQGLTPGQNTLLTVNLTPKQSTGRDITAADEPDADLTAPAGVKVETPVLWIPSRHQLVWRLAAERPGNYDLKVKVGGETVAKSAVATTSKSLVLRSPRRPSTGFFDQLLYPAEPPVPKNGVIESIDLVYPDRDVNFFGWHVTWIIAFPILAIALAFSLKGVFKVKI